MPDIKEVIDMMVADGRPESEIIALIDRYNKDNEVGKTTDPASENMDSGSDDGGLVYEYQTPDKARFPDAVSEWGKSTDGGKTFETVDAGNIPEEWFEDPKFMDVYKKETEGFEGEEDPKSKALKAIWESDYGGMFGGLTAKLAASASALTESLKDPEERSQIKQNAKDIKSDIPLHLANSWQQFEAYSMDALNKTFGDKATDYLAKNKWKPTDLEEGEEVGDATDLWMANKFKEIEATKLLYQYDGKGMVKGVKTGDASDVIGGVMNSVSSMIETMGPAILTRGASLFPQITAPMYTEYNTAKAKLKYGDDPDAIKKLVADGETEVAMPTALGVLATGLERIGLEGVTKHIASAPGKGKVIGELLWVGNKEGFTELGQFGLETTNKSLGEGKTMQEASGDGWDAMWSEEGLEMWLSGFVGGTTLGSGGRLVKSSGDLVNRALRSDNASISDVNSKISNLANLNDKKYSTRNKDVKDAVDLEIKAAEQDLKKYVTEKRNLSKVLTAEEKTSLINTLNEKDGIKLKVESLKSQLESGDITNKEFGYAVRSLNNQDKRLSESISDIQGAATTRATEQVTETVKEQIKEAGLEGQVTEMTSEEISNIEEEGFDSKTAAGEFGFIKQATDGSFEIILNKDKPMVGTAAHEFMHAVLFKTIGNNTEIQDNLGDALVDHVSALGGETSILGERLSAYGKWDGDTFVRDANFGEETITIMSESIIDGSLKFEESLFTKIGDGIRRFFQKIAPNTSLGRIKLDTGKDIFNFVKDYSKNIAEGKINKAILNVAKEGAKGELVEGKATPGATVQMSKDVERKTPEQLVKTIKRGGNPRQIAAAEDALVPQYQALALEALGYKEIKGDILRKNVVSAVNDYYDAIVRNYDPKKGKFSTHVYNNIFPKNDTIFEKAKTLAKRDESVSMDSPEARQVAGDAGVTTNFEDTFVQKIDILGFATVGRVVDKIKSLVKVKPGDNFKNIISRYAGKVGELVFDIPAKKIMEGGANLAAVTKYKEGMPAPAEAQNIQRFFNAGQNADRFIKTLPLYNITDKNADIDKVGENIEVSRNAYGIAIGLKGLPLDYFYENYTDPKSTSKDPKVRAESITSPAGRSKGLTSQTQVKRLKPEFRNPTPEVVEQFKQDIGITPKGQENVYNRDIGQLLKGAAKVYSINASLSAAQRTQEAKLKKAPVEQKKAIKQQTADITAAQSKIAFSKSNSEWKPGSISGMSTPLISMQKVGKLTREGVRTGFRDVDAMFNENVTWGQEGARIVNSFIKTNPEFRQLFETTMTGGMRGGFFLTKPEFNKAINKANKKQVFEDLISYRIEYNKKEKLTDKGVDIFQNSSFKKDQSKRYDILYDFFKAVESYNKKNPNDFWFFEELAKDTGKGQSAFSRVLAPYAFYPVNKKGKPNKKDIVVEEHSRPQNTMVKAGLKAARDGRVDSEFKVIKASFMQGSFLKTHDDIVGRAKLGDSMPDVFYTDIAPRIESGELVLPNGLAAAVRLAAPGTKYAPNNTFETIDLNTYFLPSENKTIAEYFGINAIKDVTLANEILIEMLAGKKKKGTGSTRINLNKAIAFSRSANKEAKGITVLDFDDTLATTKSGVRAKIPNMDGLPKPKRKVIFLAGGAGSGKGNVISKLGLKDQGFKIVNSDISLEWLKKNSGLPANMNDFTKEQRSKLGSLQHQARGIAKRKMTKYKGNADGVVVDGTGGSIKSMEKLVNEFKDKGYDVSMLFVETSLPVALERNAARKERSLLDKIVTRNHESVQGNKDGFKTMFGNRFMEVNTDNLSQQDAMPAKLTSEMNDFVSGYENRRLDAEEFASEGADILDQGGTFDFSEFNKVVEGQTAPLFEKAMKLQGKFGNKDMFVLTARPAESAQAIFEFLKANGLNIPLKNITGLANSTPEAKALWMADKAGEGYNDFYFADDALQNVQAVQNMLDQFDVKSKVQQAKVQFSKSMNDQFNDILENVTGIDSEKRFSIIKGRKRGESKGKFRYFIPPSHEDFVGLLYNFLGKGKEGNAHRDFFEQALIRPLNRANREYDTARQSVANDYKALNKQFEDVKGKLTKKTSDGDFTFQDAIRVYLWDKHGHKIPGLSETDQTKLAELVMSDPQLQAYAETLNVISKQETYVNPTEGWNSGDIRMDLDDATGRIGRKEFFSEFIENADIIFSEENLNKIEAGYGKGVRESLEDMLYRIQTGRNRPSGQNKQVNNLMNYLNGSVGTVMFFNMRSALLQQMSIVNYINFADNNIFAAAKAFANQKQYWKDFAFIFNSDMLKQRRGGIQTDVNGAELAASLRNSKNITRKLISKLLELGFLPTQIGDNIAIATGGAAYYRNRINKYIKQGMSQKEAEAAAFTDFQDITQSTQQSARPDMVSKQQASVIGKVILNFQNVTSQFNRLGKKAFQDIYNRRITKPNTTQMQSDISNAARITYYFAIQNAIFYTLQTALFAMMFDDDEEDVNNLFIKKQERLINGSIDSVLRGSGLIGGVVATLKNVAIAFARQRDVKYNPDESAVGLEALNLSPVLGIKLRKIVNAEKTLNYNKKVMKEMETFDIDNPQWSAATNYVEAFTNVPLNRLYNKTQNVRQSLNNDHAAWERTLMFLGWSQYNLDLENKKMEEIKEKTKSKKKGKKKKSKTFRVLR